MRDQIDFTVNGRSLQLSRRAVERTMKGVTPDPIRNHGVRVGTADYPVKQVFAQATGLDRLDFTSATARRHLGNLGFRLFRVGK